MPTELLPVPSAMTLAEGADLQNEAPEPFDSVTDPALAVDDADCARATSASAEHRHACCSRTSFVATCARWTSVAARSWFVCAWVTACSAEKRAAASVEAFRSADSPSDWRALFSAVRRSALLRSIS